MLVQTEKLWASDRQASFAFQKRLEKKRTSRQHIQPPKTHTWDPLHSLYVFSKGEQIFLCVLTSLERKKIKRKEEKREMKEKTQCCSGYWHLDLLNRLPS